MQYDPKSKTVITHHCFGSLDNNKALDCFETEAGEMILNVSTSFMLVNYCPFCGRESKQHREAVK